MTHITTLDAREWLIETIHAAYTEAECESHTCDTDEQPMFDRRTTALSDLLWMVRTYQSDGPLLHYAIALCDADRGDRLSPDTMASLWNLALHQPETDLHTWLTDWARHATTTSEQGAAS